VDCNNGRQRLIERTFDERLIRSVFEHPEVRPQIWEGGEMPIPFHEHAYYLYAGIGLVAFVPVNHVTWGPHLAVLPEHRGHGTEMLKEAVEWMFEKTPCLKLFADPPYFNKRVIRVFEKCGFQYEGFSPRSFLWRNVLHDRVLMGLEKDSLCRGWPQQPL
jgi:RimJ/RimL family protein N-acetyltransferase